jgi:hypothetical protein
MLNTKQGNSSEIVFGKDYYASTSEVPIEIQWKNLVVLCKVKK